MITALHPLEEQNTMKAFLIDRYGKSSGRIGDVPAPDVGEHDVLVRVQAASVNLLDSKIRQGEFKLILPYSFPLALGHDLAGVVVRVGSRVEQFKAGDEVYARAPDGHIGTFAEQIAVNENALAVKPASISMEAAAALPLVALTAWQVLVETARLKKAKGLHPGRFRRRRQPRHPTCQALGCLRCDQYQHRQCSVGKSPGRGCSHRLQATGFRQRPAGL